jgi:hypothetical protein
MKILKKLATIAVAALLFSSCGDSNPNPMADPNFEVPSCPEVANPLTNVPWVADYVKQLMADTTNSNFNSFFTNGGVYRLYSGKYKGTNIYLQEGYSAMYNGQRTLVFGRAFNCKGIDFVTMCFPKGTSYGTTNTPNLTTDCTDTRYLSLKANTTNITLIHERNK